MHNFIFKGGVNELHDTKTYLIFIGHDILLAYLDNESHNVVLKEPYIELFGVNPTTF